MKDITSYRTPSPSTMENKQLANNLNEFYCRFEKSPFTPLPHLHCVPGLPKKGKHQALMVCHQSVWIPVLTSWPPSSHRSSTDHWSCVKSPRASNAPPLTLASVAIKSFERLVLVYLKDTTGPLLDPLQFTYKANRSVDDAVNMELHFILHHLDRPGTYVRILFVNFSSAFNTMFPDTLQNKLTQLSIPTSICQWITSFLTDRQQLVRLGKFSSSTRTISTGASQCCVLSGHHHLPGPEVGQSHWVHCEKGPAEVVLPSPAEEDQPATGAAETVLLCHPLHVNNCLVQLSYQIRPQKTSEGSSDCWANQWYNPPQSPRTVLIQSERQGWKNHSGPLTSSTLPLWTVTVWATL